MYEPAHHRVARKSFVVLKLWLRLAKCFPIEFKEGGHAMTIMMTMRKGHDDHDEEGHDDHDEEGHDDHDEEGHDDHDEEGHDDHDEEGHDDHSGHEGHGHGAYDPHFWFDPNRVAYAAEFIESKLIERDPSNTASYQAAGDLTLMF